MAFAASMLLLVGVFQAIGGLVAIDDDEWFVVAPNDAIASFFFIPHSPFWAILEIAVDVFVVWAITRPGALVR